MGKSLRLQRDEISLTRNEKCRHFAPAGSSTQVIAGNFIIPVSQLGPGGRQSLLRCDAASCETSSHRGGTRPWDRESWCCPETAELSSRLRSPGTGRVFNCILMPSGVNAREIRSLKVSCTSCASTTVKISTHLSAISVGLAQMSGGFYWTPKSFGGLSSQTVGNDDNSHQTEAVLDLECLAGHRVDLRGDSETEWRSGPTA